MDRQVLEGVLAVQLLLARIADGRTLVEVRLEGVRRRFQSAVIALHRERGELWLDELVPRKPRPDPVPGSRCWVSGRHDAVPFSFRTTLRAVGEEDGIPLYRLAIPERVRYSQRRATYRAPVPHSEAPEVILEDEDGAQRLRGVLRDLSSGGCCVRIEAARVDQTLSRLRCTLYLPDGEPLTFGLEPRHVALARPGLWLVGGSYREIGRREQRALQRLVARLERDLARRGQE